MTIKSAFLFALIALFLVACSQKSSVDQPARPVITKLGTIDLDLVETTPIVFKGRVYRFEYVRPGYWDNNTGDSYFRFIDHETGEATPAFARGWHMGSAFVWGDTVYVTGTNIWDGERVNIFASGDLEHWQSWNALNLPGYGIFNTSMCRTDSNFVLMFEVGKPPEVAGQRFTARFATSKDLRHWQLTPPECSYTKERYSAPHCLRYLDGYFYNFYLEDRHGSWETWVVRSKDLIHWQSSPFNPVLQASEDDKQIVNPRLSPEQRQKIADAVDVNNSDIDFCEFQNRLIINYSWGNQHGTEFLAEAVYEGSLRDFLTGWFPDESKGQNAR